MNGIGFLLIILAFLFLWFVLIRPQKRRQVDQAQMWETLEVGDEIVTAGGIYGEITGFDGDDLRVEIAPQLEVRVARRAIAAVIPPEELDDGPLEEPGEGATEEAGSYSEDSR
jgi:preprotein translocase subunit YajC